MKSTFAVSLVTLLFPFSLMGQQAVPFSVGETLHYDSNLNFIPAGTAILQVVATESLDDTSVYHILFTARTNSIVDRIYRIRDRVDTWIDVNGLFTRKFSKQIREGKYRNSFSATINYEDSVVVSERDSFKISHELRDPYSLFYYLRTIPLEVGDSLSFLTFDNNEFVDIHLTVHRRETITVGAGQFDCLVVEPFREGRSLFKYRGDMTIWLSDDQYRLPVKILSKLEFGSMMLKLKSLGD